jgi:uncharacterized repeat protein (TIGR01451 family)
MFSKSCFSIIKESPMPIARRTYLVHLCVIAALVCITLATSQTSASTRNTQAIAGSLAQLYDDYTNHVDSGAAPASFAPDRSAIRVRDGLVWVEIIARDDPAALLRQLEALGLENGNWVNYLIGGWLPIVSLPKVGALVDLQFVRPTYAASQVGLVTSQADSAMRAEQGRSSFGVDGSGVTVGTLSDSYDCNFFDATSAAQDLASGDLPQDLEVLQDTNDPNCIDEGRAMMQLIHDLAPGAAQQFHTAFDSQADFAQGIRALAAAGSDVIVDDIIYYAEPMFQDGPIAQAVDDVVADGVAYFSSAGNQGRDAYESVFRPATPVTLNVRGRSITYTPHDFDPGPGVDIFQDITLSAFDSRTNQGFFILQWDQPFASVSGAPGSQNNLDMIILQNGQPIDRFSNIDDESGGDAVTRIEFYNTSSETTTLQLLIGNRSGPTPGYLKYVAFNAPLAIEYASDSGTIYGHANAAGAAAVGAASYLETPAFGTNPPVQQIYSSAGNTPIFFNQDGSRKIDAEIRPKPEFTGVDETDTTFFFAGNDTDGNGFPNFNGTSASAPHAAAVAALLLDRDATLAPQKIYDLLAASAIDMGEPGFDLDTGAGLIQADVALALIGSEDLQLEKQVEPVSAASKPITYTLQIDNRSALVARDVTLTDIFSSNVSILAASVENGSCTPQANAVVCQIPTLAGESSVEATIVVSRTETGILTNTATLDYADDRVPANNSVTSSTRLYNASQLADLSLQLRVEPAIVAFGAPITATLAVTNAGVAVVAPVTVTLSLPTDVAVEDINGTGWDCETISDDLVCTRATLAIEAAPTITVSLRADRVGPLDFSAEVSSIAPDPISGNNRASVIVRSGLQLYLPMVRR